MVKFKKSLLGIFLMVQSYNDIAPGSIIIPQQGGVAIYLFDYITDSNGKPDELLGYAVLPIEQVLSGSKAVEITSKKLSKGSIPNLRIPNPAVMVGPNRLQKLPIDKEHFFAEVLAVTDNNFQTEINNARDELDPDARISDVTAAEKARVFNYDQIANARAPREISDQPKKGTRKPNKAKSFSYVPDMYLEHAVEAGLFSRQAYDALQDKRDEIVTLQDTWLYAQSLGEESLSKSVPDFETSFPDAFIPYEDTIEHRKVRDEMEQKVAQHPVVQFAADNEITLERLQELGIISKATFEIFTKQPEDEKALRCTSLEEAFRQIGAHGYIMEEYVRPHRTNLNITDGMRMNAIVEIMVAFDLIAEKLGGDSIDPKNILSSRSTFMTEFAAKGDPKVFRRHQPDREVVKSLESALEQDLDKIKSERPPALTA